MKLEVNNYRDSPGINFAIGLNCLRFIEVRSTVIMISNKPTCASGLNFMHRMELLYENSSTHTKGATQ